MVIEGLPRVLLRLEGLALLVGSLVLYFHADFGWLLLVVLFLAPDLSFAAYALPAPPAQLALIWLGHIGIDRALGYGLKYPTAFKDTHLDRV